MVEMAVCFPVFMLMLLGIIEFGRAMMVSQLLTSAASEGCREAVIDGATTSAVTTQVTSLVTNMVGCNSADVDVVVTVTSLSSGSQLADISDAEQRDLVQIDVVVPFSAVSFAGGRFLNTANLRGRCVMRKE